MIKNISTYRTRLAKILGAAPEAHFRFPVASLGKSMSEHPPGLPAIPLGTAGKENELVFEAEMRFGEIPNLEQELEVLFKNLEDEILRDTFAVKMAELKIAEEKKDTTRAQALLIECQEISKKLHQK